MAYTDTNYIQRYLEALRSMSPFGRDYLNSTPQAGFSNFMNYPTREYSGSAPDPTGAVREDNWLRAPGLTRSSAFTNYLESLFPSYWGKYQAELAKNPESKWTDWLGDTNPALMYEYQPKALRQSVRPMQPRFLPFLAR